MQMNKKLKASALNILSGNWKSMIFISLLSFTLSYILTNVLNSIFKQQILSNPLMQLVSTLLSGVIFISLTYGIYKYSIDLKDDKQEIKTLFKYYLDAKLFFKVVGVYLLQVLFTFLKLMLFYIPGIIAMYEYALVKYLVIKEPKIKIGSVLKQSKEMMDGHKMELFSLHFSFFWWYILIFVIMILIEIITIIILTILGIDEQLQQIITRYVLLATIYIEIAVLEVYMRLSSITLFDKIYNDYNGIETIEDKVEETIEEPTENSLEETIDKTVESNHEEDDTKSLIQGNRIICRICDAKNGLKREYCWMCGKKL
jgi:uncharacterized membrane protein